MFRKKKSGFWFEICHGYCNNHMIKRKQHWDFQVECDAHMYSTEIFVHLFHVQNFCTVICMYSSHQWDLLLTNICQCDPLLHDQKTFICSHKTQCTPSNLKAVSSRHNRSCFSLYFWVGSFLLPDLSEVTALIEAERRHGERYLTDSQTRVIIYKRVYIGQY